MFFSGSHNRVKHVLKHIKYTGVSTGTLLVLGSHNGGQTYFWVAPEVKIIIPKQERLNLWFYENDGIKVIRIYF